MAGFNLDLHKECCEKIIFNLVISTIVFSPIVYSGINGTTAHSRANCVNNESITWWLGHNYDWRVVSIHTDKNTRNAHHIDTGYSYTWRQAAIHWGEAPLRNNNWSVNGYHFLLDYAGGSFPFESTYADKCSIYDGWWDYS